MGRSSTRGAAGSAADRVARVAQAAGGGMVPVALECLLDADQPVGAGIVADSDPDRELAETQVKARAALRAVALARGKP